MGVRTNLLGILEKRGDQQVYAPGGLYLVLPVVNAWTVLPISQQNLLMNADPGHGDRPVPDDITFKTKDGNNVYIDVNVMWRIDPQKAGFVVSHVGQTVEEVKERVVRPLSRSIVRDVFNEITSEEYYQVTVKNRMAGAGQGRSWPRPWLPWAWRWTCCSSTSTASTRSTRAAINAQKQAEADVQMLVERQKAMVVQKQTELEGAPQRVEPEEWRWRAARPAGSGTTPTATTRPRPTRPRPSWRRPRPQADGVRKEAEALSKLGGDAYVKIQVSKRLRRASASTSCPARTSRRWT